MISANTLAPEDTCIIERTDVASHNVVPKTVIVTSP